MYGFSEKQLKEIIQIFSSYKEIDEAILFGSRAKGTHKEASDVDIAIKGKNITYSFAAKLKSHLEDDTNLPYFFDIIAYKTITSKELKEHIRIYGKTIISGSKNIPEGWMETTLGEVANIEMGQSPKSKYYNLDGVGLPFYQGVTEFNDKYASIKNYTSKNTKIVEANTILFSVRAPVGRVNFIKHKCCIGRGNAGLYMKNNNQNFLYFLLVFIEKKLQNYTSGTVFSSISGKELKIIPVTIPKNIEEQKQIAKILTSFDDKIDLLQAQNKTLEDIGQTIFKEWFGKYQLTDELPEGWRVGKISEFISESLGGDYGKENLLNDHTEETVCLRGTDLPDMKMGTPKKAPRRFLKKSKLEKCKLINGDIIIEISGGTEGQSTGRVAYINKEILNKSNLPMTCVNFCRILRAKDPDNSYFIYSLFEYLYNKRILFNWENGTTGIKNLNLKSLLDNFDLFLPKSNSQILKFNKSVQSSFIKIQTNNAQIQTLAKTRDTLLPKLMSGKVRLQTNKRGY